MFNIPALQDVCVPCIIDGEWRWKGVESGDNWPQFPHWPVVPVVPWSLVKVMLDAGLLMMFASWHLPSARHHQPVRAVSACQHQTEKLCKFRNFDIDTH